VQELLRRCDGGVLCSVCGMVWVPGPQYSKTGGLSRQLFQTDASSRKPLLFLYAINLPCLGSSFCFRTALFYLFPSLVCPYTASESSFQTQVSTATFPAQQATPSLPSHTGLPPGPPCSPPSGCYPTLLLLPPTPPWDSVYMMLS
jgi:hypothetical protein